MSIDTPVLVLAGGLGTRLRSAVAERPKILAPIERLDNAPFLYLLLAWLSAQGVSRVVFSLGYRAQQVLDALQHPQCRELTKHMCVQQHIEAEPLGTLGAIADTCRAMNLQEDVLVLNGDTFVDISLCTFIHHAQQQAQDRIDAKQHIHIAALSVDDVRRYGAIDIDDKHNVLRFTEKQPHLEAPLAGLINAGVYWLSSSCVAWLKQFHQGSFEQVCLQTAHDDCARSVFCLPRQSIFIDYGTPEAYASLQTMPFLAHWQAKINQQHIQQEDGL